MFSRYLRFRLRLSLSLNVQVAIRQQNSHQITIHQIWIKSVKWPNGNLESKQSPNYHVAVRPTFPNLTNGNSATVQIQTQTQTSFCTVDRE